MRSKTLQALVSSVAAFVAAGAIGYASTIPLIKGPISTGDLLAQLNFLTNEVNAGVNGLIGFIPGPIAATATTAEQTLASAVIPTGLLTNTGQSIRLKCGGISASNTNAKTMKLYLGTTVISSGSFSTSGEVWQLELLVSAAAVPSTMVYIGTGTVNTTVVAPISSGNLVDVWGGALTAKCTATLGAATANDIVLQSFILEQVK